MARDDTDLYRSTPPTPTEHRGTTQPLICRFSRPSTALLLMELTCEHTFVPTAASILHADLDAFFAAVEKRDDPGLRGRPVIVGPGWCWRPAMRRGRGVRSAMGGGRARQLCPDAIVVSPRFSAYVQASRDVFAIFERTAPVVEAVSIDEAFLEVTWAGAHQRDAEVIARRLRHRGPRAGRAADQRRRRDDQAPGQVGQQCGQARRPAGDRARRGARVPAPLPVGRLWGLGAATEARLREHASSRSASSPGCPRAC